MSHLWMFRWIAWGCAVAVVLWALLMAAATVFSGQWIAWGYDQAYLDAIADPATGPATQADIQATKEDIRAIGEEFDRGVDRVLEALRAQRATTSTSTASTSTTWQTKVLDWRAPSGAITYTDSFTLFKYSPKYSEGQRDDPSPQFDCPLGGYDEFIFVKWRTRRGQWRAWCMTDVMRALKHHVPRAKVRP